MRSPAEIVALYYDRRGAQSEYIAGCRTLTLAHDGEIAVPLPEMDRNETNTTANILKQGLNQQAMRIASTGPDVFYPPTRPGYETHEKRSRTKRQVTHGWWHHNKVRISDRLRARWLIGYASAPTQIRPPRSTDPYRIPVWEPRSPLTAFPSSGHDPLDVEPGDCVFATARTWGWIRDNFPDLSRAVLDALPQRDKVTSREAMFEVLEYDDAEQVTTILIGESRDRLTVEADYGARGNQIHNLGGQGWNHWCAVLDTRPNRAGVCTVVVPGLVTLGKPHGQYHGLPAMMGMQAKLWALQLHAIKRGIFVEQWLVSNQNEDAQIVTDADPYTGQVGKVQGGTLHDNRPDPGFANLQAIDRYTYWMRQEGMIPSEFGGEGATNTRTGRRGEQVISAVVDFPIQEAQELLANSREAENRKAIAVAKAYTKTVSFYVPTKSAKGQVTYDATDLFDSDVNHCAYAHTGVDVSRATIEGLQMVGAEAMSRRSLMELHPLIDDAEGEMDRIVAERLDRVQLAALETSVMNGQTALVDSALIRKDVASGRKELHEAVIEAHERAQKRQAEVVEPGAPEAMEGLSPPGAGAESSTSPQGLEALLAKLVPPRQVA